MGATGILLGVLLLGAVVVLGLVRRREVKRAEMRWLRAWLPSWRFFEAPDVTFVLQARIVRAQQEEKPFTPVVPARTASLHTLLFAARNNVLLASHGLVDELASELAHASGAGGVSVEEAERWPSYRLVQNMVCYFLAEEDPAFQHYQLQLLAADAGAEAEELYVSPVYARR